ncbi:Transcription factor TFIIIC tau55-related protein [Zea mays]|uniref:Transcription factor TFIIIC tau55-related protein n=1 Tax=Zea mays TaxID=4577 RepID=A0A1D6JLQ4_MAIZE|nr:Transcription factor TFIIIC tau55-related protein [Zea mays]
MSEALEKDKEIDEEEEEYVLLELDNCLYSDMSPGAPFVLSGLDTLTPTLIIGDSLKMIGEYEETIGTCYLFSETENFRCSFHMRWHHLHIKTPVPESCHKKLNRNLQVMRWHLLKKTQTNKLAAVRKRRRRR